MDIYDKNNQYAIVGQWSLLQKLGVYNNSRVYLGYNPTLRKYTNIKVIKKSDLGQPITTIRNGFDVQSSLNHSNILNAQELHESITLKDAENKRQDVTAIVFGSAPNGNLHTLVNRIGALPEELARTYFHQLIDALEYMQQSQIAHRDIKPENILLDAGCNLKLAEFGCSAKYRTFRISMGTPQYFCPEEHARLPYDGNAADLFALAIVMFYIVVGHMPFCKATKNDPTYSMLYNDKSKKFWKAHESVYQERVGSRTTINTSFKDLITIMMDPNPSRRIQIKDIKKSEYYKGKVLSQIEIVKSIKARLCKPN